MGKPGLILAIGSKKPMDSDSKMKSADSDSGSEDFEAAASAMFDAVKEDDAEGFKSALKTAIMACMDSDYGE